LDINDNFFLALGCCVPPHLASGIVSGHVDNLSAIGNLNYRFLLGANAWVEPTAGFDYTYSLYDNAAQAMGLASGYVLRLQDGARLGWDFFWHGVHITPTITGLLYDDVTVTGGPIVNGAFVGYGVHRFDSVIGIFCTLRQESVGKILRFPEAFTM